ncbi:MAG: hypothetical protein K6G24_04020 [Lachnospiraceae bacterium]|nr:hypothetical protein [Lachnospiraceae bacterium]
MAGISKDPVKISAEIERVEANIQLLVEKKKNLEERLKAAYDAEAIGIFKRKTIDSKEFIALKELSDEEMRLVLEYAKGLKK